MLAITIAIIAGIVIIMLGRKDVAISKLSEEWPVTDGLITESESLYMSENKKDTPLTLMKYTYSIDGKEYRSSRIFLIGNFWGIADYANYIASKYPKGKIVKVTYQPSNPENAALEVGLTKRSYLKLVIGWFVLIIGISVNFGVFSLLVGIFGLLLGVLLEENKVKFSRKLSLIKNAFATNNLILLILVTIGIFMMGIGAVNFVNEKVKTLNAQQWPITNGVVFTSQVLVREKSGRGGKFYTATPMVKYRYSVDGQNYESDRVSFGYTSGKNYSEKVVKKFPRGSMVEVAYQPLNPENAVLKQGTKLQRLPELVGAGACLVIFAMFFHLLFWMMSWYSPP